MNELKRYRFINEPDEYGYLSHRHELDGKPLIGTSTVLGVIAKPLTWWAAELATVECLEAGEKIPTIREEYLLACSQPDKKKAIDALQKKYPIFKKARFAHYADMNKKAEKGTDLHAFLEGYVKECINENKGIPIGLLDVDTEDNPTKIELFSTWALNNIKKFIGSEVHVYSEDYWLGGIIDCIAELKDGRIGIIDFKSSKDSYKSQFLQTAGYSIQLTENGGYTAEGEQILDKIDSKFYAIVPFGAEKFKVDFNYQIENYQNGFKNALRLYQLLEIGG